MTSFHDLWSWLNVTLQKVCKTISQSLLKILWTLFSQPVIHNCFWWRLLVITLSAVEGILDLWKSLTVDLKVDFSLWNVFLAQSCNMLLIQSVQVTNQSSLPFHIYVPCNQLYVINKMYNSCRSLIINVYKQIQVRW